MDDHDARKADIESRMIEGETVPRISQPLVKSSSETVERLRELFCHGNTGPGAVIAHQCANELETAQARIAALESELERLQAIVSEQDYALIEKLLRP